MVPFHMLTMVSYQCHKTDIQLQKMSRPWNPGQRALKVIDRLGMVYCVR